MHMIKKGEYDLVNISIIGFDPNTGKSYEECQKEWGDFLKETQALDANTKWWNIYDKIRVRYRTLKLIAKRGY